MSENAARVGQLSADSRPPVATSSGSPRNVDLDGYRAEVADVVDQARYTSSLEDRTKLEALLEDRLVTPEIAEVLWTVPGGVDGVLEALVHDVRSFSPRAPSSAKDLPSFIRIFLLSQIDVLWWGRSPVFWTDHDVHRSDDLVDLDPLRARNLLGFQYRDQSERLARRARDKFVRHALPSRRPHTAGLRFTRAKPEAISLLNDLAVELAMLAPLWVTSLVRSIQHQHRLKALGYLAMLPSSHCAGYAIDVEMSWSRQFDPRGALPALLLERQRRGDVNVIDEGSAWHVCIHPHLCDTLGKAFDDLTQW